MRGYTAKVGLRKPEWQCAECWYGTRPCDHVELARVQEHRSRCSSGCPCTFTADCPHCVEGRHQCKAVAARLLGFADDPPTSTIRETARDIWDSITGKRPRHTTKPEESK